jgi:organic hydroperoxide reductase OsmC/OhrA
MSVGGLKRYQVNVLWTGNRGSGTSSYRGYERSHSVQVEGKPVVYGSSDPAYRGDASKYNPEELLLASLSSCHMLWYLHLCAEAGVKVTHYNDQAIGTMVENEDGSGYFEEVVLKPTVTVTEERMIAAAKELHKRAHKQCFIANSVNFPVRHQPEIRVVQRSVGN